MDNDASTASPLDRLARAVRARDALAANLSNCRTLYATAVDQRRELAEQSRREIITAAVLGEFEAGIRENEALLATMETTIRVARADLILATFSPGTATNGGIGR